MTYLPEEFVVEEITPEGLLLQIGKRFAGQEGGVPEKGYFARFVLEKRLWATGDALREVARRLGVSHKRMNAAGNKDRNAVTTQVCSAFAVEPARILALSIKDIKINGAWKSGNKVEIGGLAGNRFSITMTEANCGKKIQAGEIALRALRANYAIPNRFGSQRFGSSRGNTAAVGRLLLEGRHEEAVMEYLCAPGDRDEKAAAAREELAGTRDFASALERFPRRLGFERRMIAHLAGNPHDFLGAFRRLHRSAQLLFVHAVQSELFNKAVAIRAAQGNLFHPEEGDMYCLQNRLGFPDLEARKTVGPGQEGEVAGLIFQRKAVLLGNIIGYKTDLDESDARLLESQGITKAFFRPSSMPELSSKGTVRPLFVFLQEFGAHDTETGAAATFSLPAGSYATVAIGELPGPIRMFFKLKAA